MNNAIILDKEKLGHSLNLLRLRPEGLFKFKAGQFVIVPLPPDPQAPAPAKPPKGFYSICSAEQNTLEIEFIIEDREGYVSHWMSTRRPSDQLKLEGPLGKFCLSGLPRPQAFLAFKAGLAPLRSMILSLLKSESKQPVYLFLGEPELLFDAQWRSLTAEHPHFHYQTAADPAAALASTLKQRSDLDIYVAGFNREVEPMQASLEAAGFDKTLIKTEKFG